MSRKARSIKETFWKYATVSTPEGCMEWTGQCDKKGYGKIRRGGVQILVHRWAYEYFIGPIPADLVIARLCKNRACVNPMHMKPAVRGTEKTCRSKQRYCAQGHEYTPENTYTRPTGLRQCRICMRENSMRQGEKARERNRAAGRLPTYERTHCPQGHEYTSENTYNYGTGRQCKACARVRAKAQRQKRSK